MCPETVTYRAGQNDCLNPPVVMDIDVGVDCLLGLLERQDGIKEFNSLMQEIHDRLELFGQAREDEDPPLQIGFDFSGADLHGQDLHGIDLTYCWLERVDFSHSNLSGAQIGCCPGASFRRADLSGARLMGDISGATFEGACLNHLLLEDCVYERGRPPVGLPEEMLGLCRVMPSDPSQRPLRCPTWPVSIRARMILPNVK